MSDSELKLKLMLNKTNSTIDRISSTLLKVFKRIGTLIACFRNISNVHLISSREWPVWQQSILLLDQIMLENEMVSLFFREEANECHIFENMEKTYTKPEDVIWFIDDILSVIDTWTDYIISIGKSYALVSNKFLTNCVNVESGTLRMLMLGISEAFKYLSQSMLEMVEVMKKE